MTTSREGRMHLYTNPASLLEYDAYTGRLFLDGVLLGCLTQVNMVEIERRHQDDHAASEARYA